MESFVLLVGLVSERLRCSSHKDINYGQVLLCYGVATVDICHCISKGPRHFGNESAPMQHSLEKSETCLDGVPVVLLAGLLYTGARKGFFYT